MNISLSSRQVSEGLGRYRWYAAALLALVAVLNTADQAVLVVTLPGIQRDFRLTDLQVGLVSSAFVAVYGVAVLVSGHLADRTSRRGVIAAGVALWSLATLLTGAARGLGGLLLARACLGIGESTAIPAGISLLGDYFGRRERGRAAGFLGAGLQLGAGIGVVVGGAVAAAHGWRASFYVAALPGLLLAVACARLREPERGAADPSAGPEAAARWSDFLGLLRIRTFVACTLANSFVWLGISGVAGFMGLYVARRFGVDAAHAGALLAPPLLLSGLVGNLGGGWLVDWRSRRSRRAQVEVAAAASTLAAAGMVAIFNASSELGFELAFTAAASAAQLAVPALLSVNQQVVGPALRGSATALQQLVTNLLGRAGGLVAIGAAASLLHDLRVAFLLIAPAALVLAAISAASAWGSAAADEARALAGAGVRPPGAPALLSSMEVSHGTQR